MNHRTATLSKRIAQLKPCHICEWSQGLWGDQAGARCNCLRGRLLKRADELNAPRVKAAQQSEFLPEFHR